MENNEFSCHFLTASAVRAPVKKEYFWPGVTWPTDQGLSLLLEDIKKKREVPVLSVFWELCLQMISAWKGCSFPCEPVSCQSKPSLSKIRALCLMNVS